jgi:hypothetical protein
MWLERHRFLVSTVIAFVFTAVGGSIQAAAQSIATSRAAIGAGTLSPLHEWLALRDRGLPEAAASAQVLYGAALTLVAGSIASTKGDELHEFGCTRDQSKRSSWSRFYK